VSSYTWKQADTEPLEVTLKSSHASSWTLAGTVVMNMMDSSGRVKISRGACTITDATLHKVKFTPTASQTNIPRGTYRVEFEWTDGSGTVRTFPSNGYFEIFIDKQIA
jgi:hypothetical protein